MLIELIATLLFLMVISAVATDKNAPWNGIQAPIFIGLFIFTAATVFGPLSGGSFNPAVSLAPAITAGEFGNVWIYLSAPSSVVRSAAQPSSGSASPPEPSLSRGVRPPNRPNWGLTPIRAFLGSDPNSVFSGDRPGARDTRGRRADRATCALCACSGPDNARLTRLGLSD